MIRRVNLYAGPGAGKTTTARGLAYFLGRNGHNVELVREYIKDWAYLKRVPLSFEQEFLFSNQLHLEDFLLNRGVGVVISDSPIPMNIAYSKRYDFEGWSDLLALADKFERRFPSLNIFLSRAGIEYKQNGRYETPEQAMWMDNFILNFLEQTKTKYVVMPSVKIDDIVAYVEGQCFGS